MSLLKDYKRESNFWSTHPQYRVVEAIENLYKNDKSKDKSASSLLMWCLALYSEQTEHNPYGRLPQDERLALIESELLAGETLDVHGTYKEIAEKIKLLTMNRFERAMDVFLRKLEEREAFISKTSYSIENAKALDDMLKGTKDLHSLYKTLLEEIEKDKSSGGITRGGRTESLTERGQI
jgi:hypothetical protein